MFRPRQRQKSLLVNKILVDFRSSPNFINAFEEGLTNLNLFEENKIQILQLYQMKGNNKIQSSSLQISN